MSKKAIAKGYYAVFEYSSDAVEVEFPDLPGCLTFGQTMEEAYEAAIDAASGWLQVADKDFIPEKPSTFDELRKLYPGKDIMRVTIDKGIMKQYEEKKRFNASFPASVLEKVDAYSQKMGWNRSQFLIRASEKLIAENSI
ncbi:type II toxin-antitoxin system HicB family antitoxin [Desulfobacter latus]|uniref:Type II toxin-antitoxin system HicB family antitoxin n=1 Tax=Desulfobacter latus TaxID=2292 RepID=A0A850T877_9BACT|nr:type II toxin-antitoxin system HicB family antitoxin [Desulfobacter latus]NWH05345.1 type II toxin-antitoxin system HicB family antitoxin [Desulfobacter latus]